MSIDPEDSMLEEALRSDLPSNEVAQRMRRRLLAAGVAVGGGMTSATGAAATSGAAGGLALKAAGLSWGVKLGFAAAIAIPTVGLLLDSQTEPTPAVLAASARQVVLPMPVAEREVAPVAVAQEPVPESVREVPARPGSVAAVAAAAPAAAAPLRPSQLEFAPAAEAPSPESAPKLASTLAEETRLLDGAFAELAAGNRARAAQWITEHEARFPSGLLQKERERAKARLSESSRGE